ncbi:MAG: capsular biosynthesis protein [Parasporobacterium sp.]|nr:capsular biosynthesis protein [Parasporobacterium sp.]
MIGIADIHCHILPYVDDGAQEKEESRKLLKMQFEQGVRTVCCTPHLRKGMFETPDEEIFEQFERFRERAGALRKRMRFYLSREYFCDSSFISRLERDEVIPLGDSRFLLTEMSSQYSEEQIFDYVKIILKNGYRPLIAHVERYPSITKSPIQIQDLIDTGALIQVNAGSILAREGYKQSAWCKKLLKEGLVHVVASDSHDSESRPPEMDKVCDYISKKFGEDYARELLRINPLTILNVPRKKKTPR